MKDFKYCIWLTLLDTNDEWYSYTNGFEPHITIFSCLDKQEVSDKLKLIQERELNVSLTGDLIYFSDKNFNSLYYKVTITEKLDWWPSNAHVSFYYKYDDITQEEINILTNKIKKTQTKFAKIKVKKCSGHFLQW